MPGYKEYPMLTIIRLLIAVLGWLSVIAGGIGICLSLGSLAIALEQVWNHADNILQAITMTGGKASIFLASCLITLGGISQVASSELIKLFMDLQENADRQSILLTMLVERLSHEQTNKEALPH